MKKLLSIIFVLIFTASTIRALSEEPDNTFNEGDEIEYIIEETTLNSLYHWELSKDSKNEIVELSQSGDRVKIRLNAVGTETLSVYEINEMGCIGPKTSLEITIAPKPENPEENIKPEIPEENIKPENPDENIKPEIPEKIPEEIHLTIPNIFTPNGDGMNDFYHINYDVVPDNFVMEIYNRQGKLLYKSHNPDFSWDGSNNASDTYFYVLTFYYNGLRHCKKGTINIVRQK